MPKVLKLKNEIDRREIRNMRRKRNTLAAASRNAGKQTILDNAQDKSAEIRTIAKKKKDASVLANVESVLLSPTTTQNRVISQESTPKGQKIANQVACVENIKSENDQELSGEITQSATDENSNNVQRSSGRLLKQLWSSLSPKMTEIKTDADRRVSRYGRHQKQKENIDYVPVDIMRYVGSTPTKAKLKLVDASGRDGNARKLNESDTSIETDNASNVTSFSPTPINLPLLQVPQDVLLGMEEIKIITMDDNFETDKGLANVSGDQQFSHNLFERKRSSDADSAKGSSIDLDSIYRVGSIFWGAQSMRAIHWPCIVRIDPETDQIIRKHTGKGIEVHVSYFADRGRRGWVKESVMVPFEGTEDYCTRVKNIEFGKHVKKHLKPEMPKTWKNACALAEEYCAYPIEERIAKFDTQVRLELIRMKLSRNRSGNNSRTKRQALKITESELSSTIKSIKRERSDSPDSPAYDTLPGLLLSENHNDAKKMKLTSNTSESSTDSFFQSMQREEHVANIDDHTLGNDGKQMDSLEQDESKSIEHKEFKDILLFIRYYLFDGHTSRDVEKKLILYVDQICNLKKGTNRGTKRTAGRQRIHALQKTFEKLGIQSAAASTSAVVKPNAKHVETEVAIKKEPKSLEDKFIFQLDRNFLTKGLPKGFVCYICSRPNNVVKCTKCLQHVHLLCLTDDPEQIVQMEDQVDGKRFTCIGCAEGEKNEHGKKCFVCKDDSDDVKREPKYRCTGNVCTHEYHLSCLRLFPQYRTLSANTLICPYHVCHTCVSDEPRSKASHGKVTLARCIKCPAAYHPDGRCIPAGSEMLTTTQLVCPRHSLDQIPLNVNWCFLCGKGGNLICCETCPFACHRDCLPFTVPDGKYVCEACESGRMPLYNEIVIAKFGTFRWWPALTIPPPEVPKNILQIRQKPSDICLKFFHTHDMCWLNRKRMYLYQNEDSENLGRENTGSSMDKKYRSAMIEAQHIYKKLMAASTPRSADSIRSSKIVPMYAKIKTNRYVAPLKQPNRVSDTVEDSVCRCQPDDDDPCGPSSACLNRAIFMECSAKTCPAKDRCSNQRFTKRIYPALDVRYFPGKGFGLVALEDVTSGQFVIEYVGEVINSAEFERRVQQMQETKEENYYFLTVEPDMTIDGGPRGNVSRFMNHSCDPNCETQKWTIEETRVIGLFAIKDIKAGEELTFNYNLESLGNNKRECLCGAAKCSGYIGEKYRPAKKTDSVESRTLGRGLKNHNKKTKVRKGKDEALVEKLSFENSNTKNNNTPFVDEEVVLIPGPEPALVDLVESSVLIDSRLAHIKPEKLDSDD
uniref:Histone-lysine N-methyltransferase n=1 Tax=Anopheles farauti TaxID=69004 RepID=A0A182QIJ7_9DIPT